MGHYVLAAVGLCLWKEPILHKRGTGWYVAQTTVVY